uniref:Serpin peptidase inhibitor, clade B (ovalbumin), member 1, like 3 n=1 Tax=Amphiprion percula TaxID=161767 RepID=A0A3P8SEU3_AMPPE
MELFFSYYSVLFVSDTLANTTFSLALFKKLSDDNQTTNIFFSPFSISSAMAMVMLGARGNTAIQMSENRVPAEYSHGIAGWAGFDLNGKYGEKSYTFKEDFLKQSRMHYNAELESVDFKNMCEQFRVKINSWVEKQTKGEPHSIIFNNIGMQILLSTGKKYASHHCISSLSKSASLVCLQTDTKPGMTMKKTTYFPLAFIPEVNCKFLEMPYKGKKLSMLIFLPEVIEDDTTGLEKLEKQPTYETFVEWTHPDRMKNIEIEVSLPRFTMEETYDLEEILTSMGMVDAFDVTKSNFSGMSETKDLVLSKVTHKAFVEVNEEGTEAAAGSGSYILAMCARLYPRFTADHLFLFFIRHNSSMSILFAGRFCSP